MIDAFHRQQTHNAHLAADAALTTVDTLVYNAALGARGQPLYNATDYTFYTQ